MIDNQEIRNFDCAQFDIRKQFLEVPFSEKLTDLSIIKKLFDLFGSELSRLGLIVNQGKITDASFV
jgi:hypothetical protein